MKGFTRDQGLWLGEKENYARPFRVISAVEEPCGDFWTEIPFLGKGHRGSERQARNQPDRLTRAC